jgi:hypothetical protein
MNTQVFLRLNSLYVELEDHKAGVSSFVVDQLITNVFTE